ncbi:cytochrome ubiquinol oxidase subunit I [Puniceicoccus vermicola]|uniref:Cytochrome ubiquinol oxidase subunit I n=1 Tax=Puniceicoccus vermicola TaxID=388746 RepID=A0A7X1B0W0_9BACT|nr:cytochrome ubiquinol oxidase subunit I [Puniceicoccus vermicola]
MDIEILSRIQFAFTIGFHYLFPPLTIGVGLNLVIMSAFWLKTRNPIYHNMGRFWTKVFGLIFAIGVATGIVMEFQFGTNWATYSRFVGDVFGSPLAIEGIYAFFLESGFLAILLFGWDKVGPKLHFFATCMVALGAHFSAIWILVANSWMQTPAGFHLAKKVKIAADGTQYPLSADLPAGTFSIKEIPLPKDYILQQSDLDSIRAVITDFWDMVFSPSSMDRLIHTILACWLAGTFLVISISAYYLLKKRHIAFAKASMRIGLVVAAITTVLQFWSADSTARGVAENQPVKLAAIEGLADSTTEAPIAVIGTVSWERDAEGNVTGINENSVKIPALLSILVSGDFLHPSKAAGVEIKGLNDLPSDEFIKSRHPDATPEEIEKIRPEYWPNVPVVFQTYHIMIFCGVALFVIAWLGLFLWKTGRLWATDKKFTRLFLIVCVFSVFLPQLASQAGWFTAEMGRQPWIVYEILQTSEALSKAVKAEQVLFSLIMFTLIYILLFMVFAYTLNSKIKHGPSDDHSGNQLPEKWRSVAVLEKMRHDKSE